MAQHQSAKHQPIEFIVATSTPSLSRKQQRTIRSHASRGRTKKRQRPQLKSWILQQNGCPSLVDDQYTSIPPRVGWDLSFFDFPIEIQPYMQGDLSLALSPLREALYPPEICLQVDPASSSWTTALLTDSVYLHCTLFSVEAYLEACLQKTQGPLAHFYFQKTIRLLQDRLDRPDDPQTISDPTIMVVSVLGLTAEVTGDYMAAKKHMEGLRRMVDLRGGLEMLRFDNARLPAKVCRIDLVLALRFGIEPVFFNSTMPWRSFVDHGLIGKSKGALADNEEVLRTLSTLDKRVTNIWNDLKEFSQICNLASQTPHKLSPNIFSEIMISIYYRLLSLKFEDDPVAEAIRVAMMAFGAGIFFQWRGIRQRLAHLDRLSQSSLSNLKESQIRLPPLFILWLLVVQISTFAQLPPVNNLRLWVDDTVSQLRISNSKQGRQMLKSVMWIDYCHDKLLDEVWLVNT
ncbi:hypothetical protein LI328DRAFT_165955 [Trichoderma asperelloides]|nr:hypothetical protein LI328DRAFT_165955 [Trichoderma asperelloides]